MILSARFLALIAFLLQTALALAEPLRLNAPGEPEVLLSAKNADTLILSVAPFHAGTKSYPAYAQILSARKSKCSQFESTFPATIDLSEKKLGKGFPRLWISIDWMRPNSTIVLRRTFFADDNGISHLPPRLVADMRAFDPAWLLEAPRTDCSVLPFHLPADSVVSLEILDAEKHPVRKLLEEKHLPKGQNRVLWDQKNAKGEKCPPGTYTARVIAHSRLRLKMRYSIATANTNAPPPAFSTPDFRAGAFPTLLTPFVHILDNRLWRIFPNGRTDETTPLFCAELPPDGAAAVPQNATRYRLFRRHGRIFLDAVGRVTVFYEYADKRLTPLAMFGSVDGYLQDTASAKSTLSALSDKAGQSRFFVWSDLNQDGFLQENEVQFTPPDFSPACVESGWLVPGFAFRMPFRTPDGLALLPFEPDQWTHGGIPVYNLEKAIFSATILPANAFIDANAPFAGGASPDEADCLFFLGNRLYHATGSHIRLCGTFRGSILGMATLTATLLPQTEDVFRQNCEKQDTLLNVVAILQKPGKLVLCTDTGLRLDSPSAPSEDSVLEGACFASASAPYTPAVLITAEQSGSFYDVENSKEIFCIEIPCSIP
ncbi:MAG: hypothetical protein ACI4QT_07350 [Kiritimatiellia bacterium]